MHAKRSARALRAAWGSYNRGALPMELIALPAFTDSLRWIPHNGGRALAVDPGDAAQVPAAPVAQSLHLAGILVMHQPAGVCCSARTD